MVVDELNTATSGKLVLKELGPALERTGAVRDEFSTFELSNHVFSLVGIKGLLKGQAYQVGGLRGFDDVASHTPTPASINGTLDRDNHDNFALVIRDYATYDIAARGAITVNGRTYAVQGARKPGFVGGFHVALF